MQIINGVQLHFMKTGEFKDTGINVCFRSKLGPKLATSRLLLALMLCDRCKTYDTKKEMNDYFDLPYGAMLSVQTTDYGSAQIAGTHSKTINPCYVQEKQQLLEPLFSSLQEALSQPLLQEHVLEESRSILKVRIGWMEDDPVQHATTRGLKPAGGGNYLGISAFGDVRTLVQLTLDDVKTVYQHMLEEDAADISICDAFDDTQTEQLIKTHLPFVACRQEIKTFYRVQNQLHDEQKAEYRNITQSSIMMVRFTNATISDPDYYTLCVTSVMFGQYSISLLSQEVREKNSLCHPIYSSLISYDMALGVTTGMGKERIDKTISLIRKQFQRIYEGDFASDLLEVPEQIIVNSLKTSKDFVNSLIVLQYQNVLLDRQWDTEDIVKRIQAVKHGDILHAMQACGLKMIFVLTKEDADENNHE